MTKFAGKLLKNNFQRTRNVTISNFTTVDEIKKDQDEIKPTFLLKDGIETVANYITEVLFLDEFSTPKDKSKIEVYHTLGRILLDDKIEIDFNEDPASIKDISFINEFDDYNFRDIPNDLMIGHCQIENRDLLKVQDNDGKDVTDKYLKFENDRIMINQSFIPSMFSKDIYVVKEDCLGYVMERIKI